MYDIIIIGAGPSGLSVAIEAKKAGLSYWVIDKGSIVNSIQHFPMEMTFFSTPELLEIGDLPFTSAQMRPTRAEGLEYYTRVANYFQLELKLFEKVESVSKTESFFTIHTSRSSYESRNVVISTGYYDNPNTLNVPGEKLKKVSHFYTEPYSFFRQHVLVVGAKNSAAIAALELFRHGAKVTLVHRGDKLSDKIKYWILPDIENRIKEGSITAHFNTTIVAILDEKVLLQKLTGEKFEIPNDFVFAMTGYHPDDDFLRSIGIQTDDENIAPIHNPETLQTNVEGLFVAGSVVAGKNNNKIFIENGRLHGKMIVDAVLKAKHS